MGKLNIQGDLDIHNYLTATNTNLYLSAVADYSIRFRIGTTEVARINPSGCLCINTTSTTDAYKLYVSGASLFSSSAYFRSNIWANNSAIGGSVAFLPTRSTDNNATGIINYYACGSTSATSYNLGSFYFTQYSYASGTYNRVEYYDRYNLPAVAADKTTNNTYSILTTKNTITVAQGGTGRSTLTSGYALVGNGTSAVSLREITSTAVSGSTALITAGGAYSASSQAISDITRSGTTFTATRLDGTTFTFTQQDNNTYGRTGNTTSKIFLMGGTSQSTSNKTTYSNVDCYASGGYLYSGSTKVSVEGHTHSYLPLSGGTMTGTLSLKANQYFTDSASGMDCNNSDIIDLNAIYFGDAVDSAGEGINFYRSSTTWDSVYAKSGALYFHPNRATATNVGGYTVLHSNNWSSYCAAASHSHSYMAVNPGYIEMFPGSSAGHGGYIDFHYNSSSADYTSRIIESGSGTLSINSVTIKGSTITGYLNGKSAFVEGIYTGNGGNQVPSYIGTYTTRFNMMRNFGSADIGGYMDCILMNNYSWSDVPYATGLGITKVNGYPRAIIANGPKGSWAYATELLTTYNYSWWALPLSGGTMTGKLQVNAPIFGYNYTNSNNAAAFIWDKNGSNYTGVGSCNTTDMIHFGPCNASGTWVSNYNQIWRFQGGVYATGWLETDNYGTGDPGSSTPGYGRGGAIYYKVIG